MNYVYASSKELKIALVGEVVELLIQTTLDSLAHNLKTTWPTKISKQFFSSLNNYYKMHILFLQEGDDAFLLR